MGKGVVCAHFSRTGAASLSWTLIIMGSLVDFAACSGPAQCLPLFSFPLQLSVPKKRDSFTLNQLQLVSENQGNLDCTGGSVSFHGEKNLNKRVKKMRHKGASSGNVLGTFEHFLQHPKSHLWLALMS